ncbi:MAG: arylamine N-acetyltransferase [Caulobacteraceae bacterium]|nr:arylamine N-acetyltransferase [Caulobacteraceae bacterium]
MNTMELSAYLDRIAFDGDPRPDRSTLEAVQRGHLLAIPYENLDVQLGRPVTVDPAAAFDKLVTRRRGGWCYEMNGLLGWALGEIGFSVTRLASGVRRQAWGETAVGNHLVLRVELDGGQTLADAGLGDGPITPYLITEGTFGADYRLEPVEGGWWRLHNRAGARPPSFDFHLERADEAMLEAKCAVLQTDPASLFVQNLICQKVTPGGHVHLLGRRLSRTGPQGAVERELGSAAELVDVLALDFGIDEPAAAGLWPRIEARHAELLPGA